MLKILHTKSVGVRWAAYMGSHCRFLKFVDPPNGGSGSSTVTYEVMMLPSPAIGDASVVFEVRGFAYIAPEAP